MVGSNDRKEVIEDFSFSFEDPSDPFVDITTSVVLAKQLDVITKEAEHWRQANRQIIKRVTILMNNLKKNPEKSMINWPNRVAEIDSFLKEINEIHTNIIQEDNGKDSNS